MARVAWSIAEEEAAREALTKAARRRQEGGERWSTASPISRCRANGEREKERKRERAEFYRLIEALFDHSLPFFTLLYPCHDTTFSPLCVFPNFFLRAMPGATVLRREAPFSSHKQCGAERNELRGYPVLIQYNTHRAASLPHHTIQTKACREHQRER